LREELYSALNVFLYLDSFVVGMLFIGQFQAIVFKGFFMLKSKLLEIILCFFGFCHIDAHE